MTTQKNGASVSEDSYTVREMARELGSNKNTIEKILREEGIKGESDAAGIRRYTDADFEKLKQYYEDDGQGSTVQEKFAGTTIDLVKQAQGHAERSFSALSRIIQSYETLIDRLTTRLDGVEAARDSSVAAREQMLSEASARTIAESVYKAQEARKDQAWALVIARAPVLLDQVAKSIVTKDPKVRKQIDAVLSLLKGLSEEQLTVLRASGFLTDDQMAAVDVILAEAAKQRAESAASGEEKKPGEAVGSASSVQT